MAMVNARSRMIKNGDLMAMVTERLDWLLSRNGKLTEKS